MIDRHIKTWINRSKIGSTNKKLNQEIKSLINRSEAGSTVEDLDQKITSQTNRLTEQKLDEQV